MEKKVLDYEVVEVCPYCDEENVYPANMIEDGKYFELTKTYEDNLGKFTVCPFCDGSFDID